MDDPAGRPSQISVRSGTGSSCVCAVVRERVVVRMVRTVPGDRGGSGDRNRIEEGSWWL
jgi:hypothetical protein